MSQDDAAAAADFDARRSTRIGTYAGDPVKYLRDMPVIEVVGADVPVTAVGDHRDLGCGCQSGFVVGLQVRT